METDKIREAILAKAREEADQIVADAETRAREMIEKAKEQRNQKFEEEKKSVISEAHREASKIRALASLKARQGILKEKDMILNTIMEQVKNVLSQSVIDGKSFSSLAKEAIDAFETDKQVRIYVAPKDFNTVQEIINNDSELKGRMSELRELDCLGGVFVESKDSMVSIDNTFNMRLQMLMPKILPDIGNKLFGEE